MLTLHSWSLEDVEYPFVTLNLSSPLASSILPVGVPSRGQIELFNLLLGIIIIIISYLKPYSCV